MEHSQEHFNVVFHQLTDLLFKSFSYGIFCYVAGSWFPTLPKMYLSGKVFSSQLHFSLCSVAFDICHSTVAPTRASKSVLQWLYTEGCVYDCERNPVSSSFTYFASFGGRISPFSFNRSFKASTNDLVLLEKRLFSLSKKPKEEKTRISCSENRQPGE